MSLPFSSEQLSRIRDSARRLEHRAERHEEQMETLLATSEEDVRLATAALAYPAGTRLPSADNYQMAVRAQLHRRMDAAAMARQLCVAAREQHVAAVRLVCDLDDESAAGQLRPDRHAVLVVDDYEDNCEFLSMLLRDAGFVVRTASNGLEALIAAYEMQPTVIVMDVMMPVLDGVEATRLVKSIDAIRHAYVIAYTAMPTLDDALMRRLFAAVLQKPAPPELVLATVQQFAGA